MTFENEEARREHFLRLLREGLEELHAKLGGVPFTTVEDAMERMRSVEKWPMGDDARLCELAERMRHADSSKDLLQRWKDEIGFPHGAIEDILNLSDPPYYTACPNPFIEDFIKHYGSLHMLDYQRHPLAREIPEKRHDPIGLAHSYHTKISHRTIEELVRHYTNPGDVILDSFCGAGMTGVGVALVNSLESGDDRLRTCIQIDLSPAAARLAHAYCKTCAPDIFEKKALSILKQTWSELGWMYTYNLNGESLQLSSAVWCETYLCESCGEEIIPWDSEKQSVSKEFKCKSCGKLYETLDGLVRSEENYFDPVLQKVRRRPKRKIVLVKLRRDGSQRNIIVLPEDIVPPDTKRIEDDATNIQDPLVEIPYMHMTHERNNLPGQGIEYLHDFYTLRNFIFLARIIQIARSQSDGILHLLWMWINSTLQKLSLLMCYNADGIGRVMKGVYYVPRIGLEAGPAHYLRLALRDMRRLLDYTRQFKPRNIISTSSAICLPVADKSIDYIFIDPPFGGFQLYSDLNYLWEAWMGLRTRRTSDIIVDDVQGKGLTEYRMLITESFRECNRVLKPGRWMTLKFHNSSNAIWNLIQQSLIDSGFVVANVAASDKKLGTIKQITDASTVKQDLIISAYKPNGGLEERFRLTAGTEEGVWDFVRTHLKQLPVFVSKDGKAEVIAERQNYLLFDRMVAFHVQRGVTVPLSAAEFYAGLAQRFPERDGMYFLPEQVAEYDKKRMKVKEVLQLQLFVTDEASAIQWLKQQLTRKPQTFQELHPQFLKEIGGWQKHEKPLELSELLEQNFLRYDGKGPIPPQIVSWMRQSAELRKKIQEELASGRSTEENGQLSTQSSVLITRVKDRWYVPDPNKAGDLEKLRERALLREFEEYLPAPRASRQAGRESLSAGQAGKQKRLKLFRLEAVRAGFKKAWQERDYATIIAVARKIPENVLQEDPKLLMWYDQAMTRTGETEKR